MSPRQKAILFVDDDDEFLGLVVPVLEQRGHRVVVARSGASGTRTAKREELDLIVVDGLLPDTDGLTWIADLRKIDPDTPVVFVSAFWGFIESLHRAPQPLRVELVVHKPVDVARFCDRIERSWQDDPQRPIQLGPDLRDAHALGAAIAEYARTLPGKLAELGQLVQRARSGAGRELSLAQVRERAHRLRGTAGCYGLHGIGAAAAALEHAVVDLDAGAGASSAAAFARMDRAIAEAAALADAALRELHARGGVPVGVGATRILAVGDDPLFVACLEEAARAQLLEVVRTTAAAAVREASASPPDLVILAQTAGQLELLRRLRDLPTCSRTAFAVLCERDGIDERCSAAEAGASLCLVRPVDVDTLGLAIRQLVAIARTELFRVLHVTRDRARADTLAIALERRGLAVETLDDAGAVLDRLDAGRAELVVVGPSAGGPGIVGLCRLLRTHPTWQAVPVVVLSADLDTEERAAAYAAGADDILLEPVSDDDLAARVRVRIRRMRLLRERFDRDALTDLPLRGPFLERLTRSMAECSRHARSITVGLLDIDLFKLVNDTHGHLAGDRVLATLGRLLAARFRAEDLVGRWGGEEFVVAFAGQSADSMQPVVETLLRELGSVEFLGEQGRTFSVTLSAGLASQPADGSSIHALLEAADRRLYRAKRAGRARVVASD